MVTCQSSELGWEVTVELPTNFLSLGRGSVTECEAENSGLSCPSWGKVPKLGSSSSSPSAHVRVRGQAMPPSSEVPRAPSSQPRSGSATKARDSSGRAAEPLLEVIPITIWSPPTQSAVPPSSRAEELRGKSSEADGDSDSLLSNAELAAGAVSSILRESDLKRSGVLHVEEALTLSL